MFLSLAQLIVAQDDSTSPKYSLADMRSITIYDSISVERPFELRERGSVTYSPANRSGTFSDSGVLSRPHDGAKDIYRIGTEDILAAFLDPQDINLNDSDTSVDEVLTMYLDTYGELFHVSYRMSHAQQRPGTFKIEIDHMSDHVHPGLDLQNAQKTAAAGSPPTAQGEGDEPVPEKTFVQKYWIYAIPLVLVLVMSGGGEQ